MPPGAGGGAGGARQRRPAGHCRRRGRPGWRTTAGVVSYASRLMFSRWRGEMLSDVMLPPQPPQPSVIAGSSPVVRPIEPCVVGVLTTMRPAGFFRPNSRITCIVARVDRHGVPHAAVAEDLLAALAAFLPVGDDVEREDRGRASRSRADSRGRRLSVPRSGRACPAGTVMPAACAMTVAGPADQRRIRQAVRPEQHLRDGVHLRRRHEVAAVLDELAPDFLDDRRVDDDRVRATSRARRCRTSCPSRRRGPPWRCRRCAR